MLNRQELCVIGFDLCNLLEKMQEFGRKVEQQEIRFEIYAAEAKLREANSILLRIEIPEKVTQ